MGCNKCKTSTCGCGDSAFSIPANFSNDPTACPPNSEQCSEVFDMACICYNGMDIVELDIKQGDRLDAVLAKLVLAITASGCDTFGDDTSCQSPINVTVANLTDSTFDISWDAVPAAVTYQVETVYDIRVHAICATGGCYSLNFRIQTLA